MSFSQILNQALEQGKLMVDVNSRKKGPQMRGLMFTIG